MKYLSIFFRSIPNKWSFPDSKFGARRNLPVAHKRKRVVPVFLNSIMALAILSLVVSCSDDDVAGTGPIVTEEISVADFESIDFQIAGEVTIVQGEEQSVLVTSQSNIIEEIRTDVSNGLWTIRFGSNDIRYTRLEILITVPRISGISLSGSGGIDVEDFTDQGDVQFVISGSGTIRVGDMEGPQNVDVTISGSGEIEVIGDFTPVDDLDVVISGSGSFDGFGIPTTTCDVNISASGSCNVMVSDALDVTISGSGSVFYRGEPSINSNITGSGRVVDAN